MGYSETKPRGPVAAQYKSPGPVYNLPGLVGKRDHDPRSVHEERPAYSFGVRHGKWKDDGSPGPIYLPDLKYSRYGLDFSPRFSIHGRPKDIANSTQTPGPGAYSPEKVPALESPRAPSYSFGARTANRNSDKNPAPNTYNIPTLMGKSNESTHRQAPCYTQVGRSNKGGFHEDLGKTPGPGQYKVTSPNAYKRKSPHYSITGRTPVVTDNTRKPGPGAHFPEKVTIHLPKGPTAPMGIRHSEYKANIIPTADE